MTDIEQYKPQAAAPIQWEQELKGAAYLVKSGLVPRDIKSAESALFVILAGRDMGLSPVQALRGIKPIQGKLELSADLQLGLYHRSGGKSQWVTLTANEATLKLQAPWSIEPHLSTFTIEDAKKAGLLSNATWGKYPKAMLRSRAITQGLKDIGFLLGQGVYAPGELGGGTIVDESTGEVLPGEIDVTPAENITAATGTDGAVEALTDQARQSIEEAAVRVTELIQAAEFEKADEFWQGFETDEQVAMWAILDKSVKKVLKSFKDKRETDAFVAQMEAAEK
jgi:hypothetical protein